MLIAGTHDADRFDLHRCRRPPWQPAQLDPGEDLVRHPRARTDRDRGYVRAPAARARERRRARRPARRADRIRRPARGPGHSARRSVARPRVLVSGGGALRRPATAGRSTSRRRERPPVDVRAARRDPDRDAPARPGARAQLGTRPVGVCRGGPGARERAAPGRAARPAGRAERVARAAGRGHRRRAPPDRAQPARRHAAAARLDRDVARAARVEAGPDAGRRGADRARGARPRSRSRSRSCAS